MNTNAKNGTFTRIMLALVAILIAALVMFETNVNLANAAAVTDVAETSVVATEAPVVAELVLEPIELLMPMDEFLATVEGEFNYKSYVRLFEMYGYEEFMTKSEIPQYFQTMYNNPFATGTIRTSGCGITSVAMISTYLFEQTITPDMLTFGYRGDNPASAMERAVRKLGLNMTKYYGKEAVSNLDPALEAGCPVIILTRAPSIFTEGGHFIVVTGKTEDGRYLVNDPYLGNYYRPEYVDEYLHGFTRDQMLRGLVGVYVFDSKDAFQGDPSLIPQA